MGVAEMTKSVDNISGGPEISDNGGANYVYVKSAATALPGCRSRTARLSRGRHM
jgi:hypothetical protein